MKYINAKINKATDKPAAEPNMNTSLTFSTSWVKLYSIAPIVVPADKAVISANIILAIMITSLP